MQDTPIQVHHINLDNTSVSILEQIYQNGSMVLLIELIMALMATIYFTLNMAQSISYLREVMVTMHIILEEIP